MIPLVKNTFYDEVNIKKGLADFILQSKALSMGKQCFYFEEEFADLQSSKGSVLFNSGGSANLAMLQALLNLGKLNTGDKIGFSALTWSTNVMPILQLGLIPVPIDVNTRTFNVMSSNLLDTVKKIDLKAFFATNVLGFLGDLHVIKKEMEGRGIIFLEDNCESLGAELPQGRSGSFGLGASFSFYVAHHMSTIEGGCVVSDDEELLDMLKIVRANGWDRNLEPGQQRVLREKYDIDEFYSNYTFYDLGYNLRPTEITGYLGRSQLTYINEIIDKRIDTFLRINEIIKKNPNLVNIDYHHMSRISPFAIPVIARSGDYRNKILNVFTHNKVEVRPMIAGNIQNQPFYRKYVKNSYSLPNSDFISKNGFYLGNYPEINEKEIQLISNCLSN